MLQPTFRRLLNQWCVSRDAALLPHRLTALTHPTLESHPLRMGGVVNARV